MSFVYFRKSENGTPTSFKQFNKFVKNQKSIKITITDNGGKFYSARIKSYLKQNVIVQQNTNP